MGRVGWKTAGVLLVGLLLWAGSGAIAPEAAIDDDPGDSSRRDDGSPHASAPEFSPLPEPDRGIDGEDRGARVRRAVAFRAELDAMHQRWRAEIEESKRTLRASTHRLACLTAGEALGERIAIPTVEHAIALARLLRDERVERREAAVEALGYMTRLRETTPLDVGVLPELQTAGGCADPDSREAAVRVLGLLCGASCPVNDDVVAMLWIATRDAQPRIRVRAGLLLARHLGAQDSLVEVFVGALAAREADSRVAAIRGLGILGARARGALASLALLHEDEETHVRTETRMAIAAIEADPPPKPERSGRRLPATISEWLELSRDMDFSRQVNEALCLLHVKRPSERERMLRDIRRNRSGD